MIKYCVYICVSLQERCNTTHWSITDFVTISLVCIIIIIIYTVKINQKFVEARSNDQTVNVMSIKIQKPKIQQKRNGGEPKRSYGTFSNFSKVKHFEFSMIVNGIYAKYSLSRPLFEHIQPLENAVFLIFNESSVALNKIQDEFSVSGSFWTYSLYFIRNIKQKDLRIKCSGACRL